MHRVRRLTIPVFLLVAGTPAVISGADGWLSVLLDGSIQPMGYDRTTDLAPDGNPVISNSYSASMDLNWRVGMTALLRIPTTVPVRPVIGLSLNLDTLQRSEGGGEPDTAPVPPPNTPGYLPPVEDIARYEGHLWTWDLILGMSFLVNKHIVIDVLPYMGLGRGHATSNISYINGDSTVYNPDLSMRELGLRAGISFISDHGMTFSVYGGYCRRYMDEDGSQFDTVNGATTMTKRTDTTDYRGVVVGISWGVTL